MNLYLVQHGEAEAKARSEGEGRALTAQGRRDVARIATFIDRAGIEVHQIRHSDKRRARETADILSEHLSPAGGSSLLPGLRPDDDPRQVAELVNRQTRSLMLVGHRPFMERLAGLLVAGSPDRIVVCFEPGGIVCLEQEPKTRAWSIAWAVTPELLPRRRAKKQVRG
jgi:phosphohistidine phosphatase